MDVGVQKAGLGGHPGECRLGRKVRMPALENPVTGLQSSRRNLIRISALLASAIIAKTTPMAAANNNNNNNNNNSNSDRSCFLKGTTIRTVDGDIKIEDLAVGDLLPTVFGGICPIQWVGRYRFKRSDPTKAWVKNVLPIRVARSALGLMFRTPICMSQSTTHC